MDWIVKDAYVGSAFFDASASEFIMPSLLSRASNNRSAVNNADTTRTSSLTVELATTGIEENHAGTIKGTDGGIGSAAQGGVCGAALGPEWVTKTSAAAFLAEHRQQSNSKNTSSDSHKSNGEYTVQCGNTPGNLKVSKILYNLFLNIHVWSNLFSRIAKGARVNQCKNDGCTPLYIASQEGHTDAVGTDEANLLLSDRRAETIAVLYATPDGLPQRFRWRGEVHEIARVEGRLGEPLVVLRHVGGEEGVGLVDGVDAVKPHRLDESILQRGIGALHAALRLRRVRADQVDIQPFQRASKMGHAVAVRRGRVVAERAVLVRIEGDRLTVPFEVRPRRAHVGEGAFALDHLEGIVRIFPRHWRGGGRAEGAAGGALGRAKASRQNATPW